MRVSSKPTVNQMIVGQAASATAPATKPVTSEKPEPFQIKGTAFKLMVLRIVDPRDPRLLPKLEDMVRQAPSFFGASPIVLDFGALALEPGELEELVARLRDLRLVPVGAVGTSPELAPEVAKLGLAMMPAGRGAKIELSRSEVTDTKDEPREDAKEEPPLRSTMLITEPVRSGRQIYAAKADLVIVAPVGAGSEILADGHIHVYDTLRGRALAGLNGDRSARIFCRKLEAELVSIAGLYKVSEDIDRSFWQSNVQIFLNADRLCLSKLG